MKIFSLLGEILLKDDGIESKLDKIDKKAGLTSSGMDKAFSGLMGTVVKLGAVIGAGMGIKTMIDKAAAGQEKVAQLDAVLKSTSGAAGMTKDELLKLADAQGKITTYSKGANIETENLLLTFTNIGKKVFPDALKTVNDMSTALGQDTKSSAIQLGKALNDPIAGITALSRVGVNFTDKQKEQIKTLVESGKTMDAQKVILKELSTEFGGSAEAIGKTFNGQMTILKNQVSGVGSAIGAVLIPYLTDFTTKVNQYLPQIKQVITDVINFVVPKFQDWAKLIGQIASELFPSFNISTKNAKDSVYDLANNGLNLVTDILKWIRDNMGIIKEGVVALTIAWVAQKVALVALSAAKGVDTAATIAAAFAQGGFNAALQACPIIWIIDLLALLGFAIYEIITHWKEIKQWIVNTWDALNHNPIGQFIIATNPLLLTIKLLTGGFKDVVEWVEKAWNWLTKWNGTKATDKNVKVSTSLSDTTIKGGYAVGTPDADSGWHWVGENGPELMNFKGGEKVIDSQTSKSLVNGNQQPNSQPIIVITQLDGREIARATVDPMAEELEKKRKQRSLAVGGAY